MDAVKLGYPALLVVCISGGVFRSYPLATNRDRCVTNMFRAFSRLDLPIDLPINRRSNFNHTDDELLTRREQFISLK